MIHSPLLSKRLDYTTVKPGRFGTKTICEFVTIFHFKYESLINVRCGSIYQSRETDGDTDSSPLRTNHLPCDHIPCDDLIVETVLVRHQ